MSAEGFEEFVAIVDHGTVTAAAASMGLPRPTLSRRLARLEERLAVKLLHRTTRRIAITEQGQALYAKARRVVEAAREAEAHVRRLDGVPRGLLRVSVPSGMPEALLGRWIIKFLAAYPEVRLEVVSTAAHLDLVGQGIDVALRAGPIEDPSLIARTLARDLRIGVASPDYLARRGTPSVPEDLERHNCLLGYRAGTVPERRWPLLDGGWIPVSGSLATNEMMLRLQGALQGLGIAVVVDRLALQHIADGELEVVLPDSLGRRERLSLVYAGREFLDPKIKAWVEFLSAEIHEVRSKWSPG